MSSKKWEFISGELLCESLAETKLTVWYTERLGWESVCWGVPGTPCLIFVGFKDLSRFHYRKIMFLEKTWETPIVVDPRKNKIIHKHPIVFQKCVCFRRFHSCFENSRIQKILCFKIFIFPKNIKKPPSQNSVFLNTLWEANLFCTTRIWKQKKNKKNLMMPGSVRDFEKHGFPKCGGM